MNPFNIFTLGLLGLSITIAQPVTAQERGATGADRGEATGQRGDDSAGRGSSGGRYDEDSVSSETSPAPSGPTDIVKRSSMNTTTGGPISEEELDLTCGAGGWLETWLEDANGNPIPGTYEYFCLEA